MHIFKPKKIKGLSFDVCEICGRGPMSAYHYQEHYFKQSPYMQIQICFTCGENKEHKIHLTKDNMQIEKTDLVSKITDLENEVTKQTKRAERWKALAAKFHSGMSHIFQQYEQEIDGRATPQIDTGGLYRCCVEIINTVIASDSEQAIKRVVCDRCLTVSILSENKWSASNE